MRPGFVIMQIGNAELDAVYREVIAPAMRAVDVEPIRVDRHNEGRLLNTEIARFIRAADIIVADLTNERPNCYLEVGFAMGIGKFENLVLSARADHRPDRAGRTAGDPKVHFDLGGYDLLYWDPANTNEFRSELERRIRFRLSRLPPQPPALPPWDPGWLTAQRSAANAQLSAAAAAGYLEVVFGTERRLSIRPERLLDAAERCTVRRSPTSGWPLFIVFTNGDWRPRPVAGGILTRVAADDHQDYWMLSSEGGGYLANSFFEDARRPGVFFWDFQIFRVAEVFLYLRSLFATYELRDTERFTVAFRHVGLRKRVIRAANSDRGPFEPIVYRCEEEQSERVLSLHVAQLSGSVAILTREVMDPIFELFDFFKVDERTLEELLVAYTEGRIN
jgi:hypothetical protein